MNEQALSFLQSRLEQESQEDYSTRSRIHRLNSFDDSPQIRAYVKREDELGFGISGAKFRKYRTLMPFLRKDAVKEVIVIGGAFSNHVLAITQLLIENSIIPTLFLRGPPPSKVCGNFLFLQLLVSQSAIHWIAKDQWPQVEALASNYAAKKPHAAVLPEGGELFSAFLGALTLPLDILRNERECGIEFDHVFIDAGTGLSAAALVLGFALLEKPTTCHILLLADSREDFQKRLEAQQVDFERWLGRKCPMATRFICDSPTLAPSFGSTNAMLFDFLIETARIEGFFLDPIYSGKLFYHVKKKIQPESLSGNILFIHSGGALTLAGFQDALKTELRI